MTSQGLLGTGEKKKDNNKEMEASTNIACDVAEDALNFALDEKLRVLGVRFW